MKRLYYLFTIALFVACTNDEEMNLLIENLPEESVSVEKRSFQEALEVAQNAPEIFGGTTTRGELNLDDGVSSSSNSNNYSYEVGIIANIRR